MRNWVFSPILCTERVCCLNVWRNETKTNANIKHTLGINLIRYKNKMVNKAEIITVRELLKDDFLRIPNYQRPYKWTEKNVNQLIDDILTHKEKSEYRLGTLVVHDNQSDTAFDIVDGQQRTITLTLIAYALTQKQNKSKEEEKVLEGLEPKLIDKLTLTNEISISNIQNNYQLIKKRIADFDEKTISFFLDKCTLVKVVLTDISEAFQFFDSQNSRGKGLEPHDLLKAYHLREMISFSTEEERQKVVEKWETYETKELSELFSNYLFRIRNWSRGNSAQYFSKSDIDVFKGVNPYIQNYPFAEMLRIAHFYVEEYNRSYHRNIDKKEMRFPFQIDGMMINGKRFFEMIDHYKKMIDYLKSEKMSETVKSEKMSEEDDILTLINNYEGSFRIGDKYIRNLFYCGLIYYIDKFGYSNLPKAIEIIFIWAYSLRLKLKAIRIETIDNYALHQSNHSKVHLFKKIKEAIKPSDILNIRFDTLKKEDINSTKTDKIKEMFKKLKYYHE